MEIEVVTVTARGTAAALSSGEAVGYYIRVLSPSDDVVPYSALTMDLSTEHPKAALSIETGSDTEWNQLLLSHQDGSEIAVVERHSAQASFLSRYRPAWNRACVESGKEAINVLA